MTTDASQVTLEVNYHTYQPKQRTLKERQDSMKNNILVLLKPNQTKVEQYAEMLDQYQEICEKLNKDIGFYWWKRYVAAAFWANVSTPFNLSITLITAMTTGQAATQDLLSSAANLRLSVSALIISTINTFFRPHDQMNEHLNQMNDWAKFGGTFDTIYYRPDDTLLQLREKIIDCYALWNEINTYRVTQPYRNSFLTDLIHLGSEYCCLKGRREYWIKTIKGDFKRKQKQIKDSS
jgi:hypothetical protein